MCTWWSYMSPSQRIKISTLTSSWKSSARETRSFFPLRRNPLRRAFSITRRSDRDIYLLTPDVAPQSVCPLRLCGHTVPVDRLPRSLPKASLGNKRRESDESLIAADRQINRLTRRRRLLEPWFIGRAFLCFFTDVSSWLKRYQLSLYSIPTIWLVNGFHFTPRDILPQPRIAPRLAH